MATTKSRRAARGTRARSRKTAPKTTGARTRERRERTPESLRLRAFQPSLTVGDLEKSIRFYSDVLGFTVSDRWTGDGGVLRGVMLKAGACELGLAQDDWAKGRDRQKGAGFRLWCTTVQDIDALAQRIKSAGARLTEGPVDQSWGGRSLSIDDPDGFHLTIYSERQRG
jgi:lactoylglutathione lyase